MAQEELLSHARGDVLEVGIGTGLNIPHYRFAAAATPANSDVASVRRLVGVDLSSKMLDQVAKERGCDALEADPVAGPASGQGGGRARLIACLM